MVALGRRFGFDSRFAQIMSSNVTSVLGNGHCYYHHIDLQFIEGWEWGFSVFLFASLVQQFKTSACHVREQRFESATMLHFFYDNVIVKFRRQKLYARERGRKLARKLSENRLSFL